MKTIRSLFLRAKALCWACVAGQHMNCTGDCGCNCRNMQ